MTAPFDRLEERYLNDPMFHAVVQQLQYLLLKCEMSPSEIREAAMYAVTRFEMRNPHAVLRRLEMSREEIYELEQRVRLESLRKAKRDD